MTSRQWAKISTFQKFRENLVVKSLLVCASISVLTTLGIIFILLEESLQFFQHVSVFEFLGSTEWAPLFEPRSFGVLPLISGTLLIAFGALIFALPIGLGIAVYTSQYAQGWWQKILKPVLEILAGIPSVVYGYFAITRVTPMLQFLLDDVEVFNAASASIVIAIMVLPTIASICDDSLRAVPKTVKDGAYALGARKSEVIISIVVPSALSGILASFILAFSRAIGETMAVTLAAGGTPNMTLNPFEGVQAMTAYIAQVSLGDVAHGTIEYRSIFAVGLVLFLMTLVMNLLSQYIVKRYARKYE
ncbi:MAG TPA: phosphate ABC transporter permease subunit PstC [Oligoflexus sp.]|uniref:phosphate ABC transporter permease subunit PstC n=1 Tax=Oligoflexus sp. TaxID=1971216 RepID=UPI002D555D63|nr:phosphate ABC transporter permease subunit PstC [Oligoflexus sp.]HYX39999.1 phosphate ABC transporter permease subunit PstC [Oligoflexus sp.]